MKKLSYVDYSNYYALRCKVCQGEKRLKIKDVWTACSCQTSASLKFKFEQLEVDPPNLKYKSWDDFDGFVNNDLGQRSLAVSPASLITAKQKAFQYCFGSSDYTSTKDRRSKLCVQKHRTDGQNVIIVGHRNSGRTLLAALILKEVVYACGIHDLDLSFKCIKAYELHDAARWDNDRNKSYDILDEVKEVDFLLIDEVELLPPRGHHTNPADYYTMNSVFDRRVSRSLPTIVVCSPSFWSHSVNPKLVDDIIMQWGRPFVQMITKQNNVIIDLKKE